MVFDVAAHRARVELVVVLLLEVNGGDKGCLVRDLKTRSFQSVVVGIVTSSTAQRQRPSREVRVLGGLSRSLEPRSCLPFWSKTAVNCQVLHSKLRRAQSEPISNFTAVVGS